ncbi:hypothetical protein F4774DRAFT_17396 [Daldinia eschscholtzii]|nr:hypothetical protein F4774DRAFT_17396 [Daldinia eschscholtzii]
MDPPLPPAPGSPARIRIADEILAICGMEAGFGIVTNTPKARVIIFCRVQLGVFLPFFFFFFFFFFSFDFLVPPLKYLIIPFGCETWHAFFLRLTEL